MAAAQHPSSLPKTDQECTKEGPWLLIPCGGAYLLPSDLVVGGTWDLWVGPHEAPAPVHDLAAVKMCWSAAKKCCINLEVSECIIVFWSYCYTLAEFFFFLKVIVLLIKMFLAAWIILFKQKPRKLVKSTLLCYDKYQWFMLRRQIK